MTADELRAIQAPLKERFRNDPESAKATLRASGRVDLEQVACHVETAAGPVAAGLHPLTGGDGSWVCSADMLLEALAGCAGVTLRAVALAMGIELRSAEVTAEGDLDFRGTLGVSREAPVGFTAIRLLVRIDTPAEEAQVAKLIELTERYCVVAQTLKNAIPVISVRA